MKVLDLFCGAGGAAMGYHRAGFDVVGIDIKPQPRYPFTFVRADALDTILGMTADAGYALIHASPPCQEVSSTRHLRDAQGGKGRTVNLIPQTRKALQRTGLPYVIENVPRAPLIDPIWLCGSMFGLQVPRGPLRRHRGFETNIDGITAPADTHRSQGRPLGVYGTMRDDIPSGGRTVESLEEGRALMGIDWMRWSELIEAVPPAYTEWLGRQILARWFDRPLLAHLEMTRGYD